MALATKVYEEAAKQAQANEGASASNDESANEKKDDNIKDAEFEEK